jgi:vacuolar-type H+-ATPase subunit I/STV1
MKRVLMLLSAVGLGLLALALSSCSSTGLASPRTLALQTKGAVGDLKETEQSIYQTIEKNLSDLRNLSEELPTISYNEAVRRLQKITESFEELAKDEGRLEREILSAQRSLKRLTSKSQEELSRLRARKSELERELATFQHPNPRITEIKRKSLSQTIKYVTKQIEIWEQFLRTQRAIEIEARKINERVEEFLIVVEANAILYREALNLLELQRDIREASALLSQIPEIERLAQEMVSHWDLLDSLVEELLSLSQ